MIELHLVQVSIKSLELFCKKTVMLLILVQDSIIGHYEFSLCYFSFLVLETDFLNFSMKPYAIPLMQMYKPPVGSE